MRAARAKNAGTSDVYIDRRRRERGSTDSNERKRKGRESAYARREGGERNSGGTFACLRRFRAVSGNKRQTRTTEKVSVARFARVHLTKKSNIYFPARTRARTRDETFLVFLFATSCYMRGPDEVDETNVKKYPRAEAQ